MEMPIEKHTFVNGVTPWLCGRKDCHRYILDSIHYGLNESEPLWKREQVLSEEEYKDYAAPILEQLPQITIPPVIEITGTGILSIQWRTKEGNSWRGHETLCTNEREFNRLGLFLLGMANGTFFQ
jgi:hypothetical protein